MKVSIILPSYLGLYEANGHKSATDRIGKLNRAIVSVFIQSYMNWELIVVSDGCDKTNEMVGKLADHYECQVKLIKLPKQPLFSGAVRQAGVDAATGELICYLDSDDFLGGQHLGFLAGNAKIMRHVAWFYYDDYLVRGKGQYEKRNVIVEHSHIGTSSFCHWRSTPVHWPDGYGHDWRLIEGQLLNLPHEKIDGEYYVAHVSAFGMDY